MTDATERGGAIHRVMPLEEARAEIDGWLDEVKLKTGKCSQLMRDQLAEHMRHRTQSVFSIYDEIGQIEQSDPPRSTGTKPAAPLKRELAGLMHKHYKVSSLASFALNQLNHWERRANQPKLAEIIDEFIQDGHTGKLAHELVLGAHTGRHGAEQTTGEWIVYAVVGGVNYYLTLATHTEPDSAVRARVMSCFTEFPELRTHLRWEDEMAKCPLCDAEAEKLPTTGDWSRYDCPNDKLFDITGTAEAEIRHNPDRAKSHRERIGRERARGIKIPQVGVFASTHQ